LKVLRKTAIGIPSVLTGYVERLVGENAGTRRRARIFALHLDDLEHAALLRQDLRAARTNRYTQSNFLATP
jgi:hypothetical protein